ncbi:hypothetical protein MKX03_030785 [Papaver bracteatum]|nr:hypothetical protein MKX03_030785 [Papaver bracteatum]
MEENPGESYHNNEDEEDNSFDGNDEIKPMVGMTFDEHEDMFQFYKEYARKLGYPVRKRSKRTNVDGITRSVTFACSKSGEHESQTQNQTKPQGTVKSGCIAHITGRKQVSDNKWYISVVHLEHNHGCNPDDARFF